MDRVPPVLACCKQPMAVNPVGFKCVSCCATLRLSRQDYFICNMCEFYVHRDFHTTMRREEDEQDWCITCFDKDWDDSPSE
jgi:hypothetical protein